MSINSVYQTENKNKNRKRGFPLIRILLFIFAATLVWKFGIDKRSSHSSQKSQDASVLPMLDTLDRRLEQSLERPLSYMNQLTHVVKPGDTFDEILSNCDISKKDADEVYRSLKPLGLPALFPGDSLIVKKSPEGGLQKLALLSRLKYWYRVTRNDSLIKAEKSSLGISTYRCLVNGTLESSLSEEIAKFGVGEYITSKFADIFAWDINFFLDPRKGDTFQILFEEKFAEGHFVGYGEILAARYTNDGKDYYAFAYPDENGNLSYYDENGKALQKQFLKAPLKFTRISSNFSFHRLHPVLGIVRPHLGIDYAAPRGTPIYAAADGVVTFAGPKGGFGKFVSISHGYYETTYGHLQGFGNIRRGSRVKQGDMIGTVGATGLATGPHLDYRMKRGSEFVNPSTISLPSKKSIPSNEAAEFQSIKGTYNTAFEHRFNQHSGFHILDIENTKAAEAEVNQVSRTALGDANGDTPGS